jgi:kelch-like protein 20
VEIPIGDIDFTTLTALIDFCYTSKIVIEESNVQTILPAACLLQLHEIQDVCCDFLKKQLDPSNCLGIRAFADTHACRDLLRIADKFTQHNFQEVTITLLKQNIMSRNLGVGERRIQHSANATID